MIAASDRGKKHENLTGAKAKPSIEENRQSFNTERKWKEKHNLIKGVKRGSDSKGKPYV